MRQMAATMAGTTICSDVLLPPDGDTVEIGVADSQGTMTRYEALPPGTRMRARLDRNPSLDVRHVLAAGVSSTWRRTASTRRAIGSHSNDQSGGRAHARVAEDEAAALSGTCARARARRVNRSPHSRPVGVLSTRWPPRPVPLRRLV